MQFSYGKGIYIEGEKRVEGVIILDEFKIFLKGLEGDFAQTYIPLDKIERVKKAGNTASFHVRPSISFQYEAKIQGEKKYVGEFVKDIVQRRGLKKQFLRQEWVEDLD